ncbi:MAG: hypothetical protein CMJ64_05820 [Planctomycetaceae bacterium]|nr:hypothetical protein [Planctomycetaceae bacterium]
MRFYLILLGIAGVLVGLGFVFPQVANTGGTGSLKAVQIVLLSLGVVISVGGVVGMVARSRRLLAC